MIAWWFNRLLSPFGVAGKELATGNDHDQTPRSTWREDRKVAPDVADNFLDTSPPSKTVSYSSMTTKSMTRALRTKIIKTTMYVQFYDNPHKNYCFELAPDRLFFIANSAMIQQIVQLETSESNPYTVRWQAFKHNQALLERNPVSLAFLSARGNYVNEQYRLFVQLAREISFEGISCACSTISGADITSFVLLSTAQVYIPMLLGVESSRIPLYLDQLQQLLNVLESATGKHNVTFDDVLQKKPHPYSDQLEEQYIRMFHKLVLDWKGSETNGKGMEGTASKEQLCMDIVEILADSNIMRVLTTVFDIHTDAVTIVNNILSWIDNMLNVVHTIVNMIVLSAITNRGNFDHTFYTHNLPRARALATMFMRHVQQPFDVMGDNGETIQFRQNDMIMMSNATPDTLFGGKGRQCPSQAWSYKYMEKLMIFIGDRYHIRASMVRRVPVPDSKNDSWFWNKLSTRGVRLVPRKKET